MDVRVRWYVAAWAGITITANIITTATNTSPSNANPTTPAAVAELEPALLP
jgi:hypothetical protein